MAVKAFIHLIVQYFNDHRPKRQAEFDDCVRRNLGNPWIAGVHGLIEPDTEVPDWLAGHAKYREQRIDHWLTYRTALDYANEALAGETVCIANLDIFLDADDTDWSATEALNARRVVLCLSRYEYDGDGAAYQDPTLANFAFAHTQDAWVFRPPLEVVECDFEIGMLGCDNAFAERLKRSGYIPFNAPSRFKIVHLDRARGKTAKNFMAVHAGERARQVENRHPEEEGQYLVPAIGAVKSIDKLLTSLKVSDLDRYTVACDIFTRFVKTKNP